LRAPYYQDEQVTLYHGDCLEIEAWRKADVLVTDPPYGMNWTKRETYIPSNPKGYSRTRGVLKGDDSTAARDAALSRFSGKPAIVFGSWKIPRPDCRSVLIWDKLGSKPGPLNAAFYTTHDEIYIIGSGFRASSPPQRSVISTHETRIEAAKLGHPTTKPVRLMEILIDRCPPGVIADPFAGSGSTLVAVRNLGRKAIGVELEEHYCELIARRLDQMCFNFEEPA
jgi:DNA modification methylase